jgi:benzodiazapine receptor
MTSQPWFPIAFAAAWSVGVLGAGGMVTNIGTWYRALRKPPWQPPDWLFGPAWTLIFVAASVAFVMAWRAPGETAGRVTLVTAYLVNGALNFLWSLLFFGRRRPDLALVEVVPLWISIAAMMAAVAALRPGVVWMLVPYLAWVSFAAVLNRTIVRLNAPFA